MITYLKNVRLVTKQHLVYKELSEIYEMIRSNPEIKMTTKDLRTWMDSNKYIAGKDDELDKKFREQKSQMPAFISAGEFENAYNDGISLYYGYITIDVDKIINVHPRILINSITSEDKSIAMAFISPSGKGIKFIHCLDYRGLTTIEDIQIFHNSAFEALKKRYLDKYTINIDESGRDISRKCFISHDPEAYWNENPEKFSWGFNLEEEKAKFKKEVEEKSEWYERPKEFNAGIAQNIIMDIINFCNKEHKSIADAYEDWIKVGFAILNCGLDSETSEGLFRELSRTSIKYNADDFKKKWDNLISSYNPAKKRTTSIGTIIWMAKNLGYDVKKVKTVNSAAFVIWILTQLEIDCFRIRMNSVKGLEIQEDNGWRLFDDNDLSYIVVRSLESKISKDYLRDLLISFSPKYNPIALFREQIDEWDGIDYLEQLYNSINYKTEEDKKMARIFIRKWMIGIVNTLFNPTWTNAYNENVLVLIGEQYIGKSRWVRKLLPVELTSFYAEGSINPREKDHQKLAATNIIIFMDELSGIVHNKIANEDMKSFLSQPIYKFREPYGRFDREWKRMASFVGTSNEDSLLTDLTGNRRYWIFEVTKLNAEHNINIIGLWSQIYAIWKTGEAHWLNSKEFKMLQDRNEKYRAPNAYEELIGEIWSPKGSGKPEELTSTEIIKILNDNHNYKIDISKNAFIGRTLKKMGFQQVQRFKENKRYVMFLKQANKDNITSIISNKELLEL